VAMDNAPEMSGLPTGKGGWARVPLRRWGGMEASTVICATACSDGGGAPVDNDEPQWFCSGEGGIGVSRGPSIQVQKLRMMSHRERGRVAVLNQIRRGQEVSDDEVRRSSGERLVWFYFCR
jgi:hypothetical protein